MSEMTIEQHMEHGDFEAALALLATRITGAAPDPGLMAFGPENRTSLVGILQVRKIELDAPAPAKPSFWKKLFN